MRLRGGAKRGTRLGRKGINFHSAGMFCACLALMISPASADDAPRPDFGWRQAWTGADVHSNGWLMYAGATVSPYSDIYSDGLRLRATTGYGGYGWEGKPDADHPLSAQPKGNATTDYADLLVGYYKQMGPATVKAFVGVAMIEHHLGDINCRDNNICDPETVRSELVHGSDWGPKASFEIWLNIGSDAFASFDASYTTAHETFSSHTRLGYRVLPNISAGLEAAVNSNARNNFLGQNSADYRGGAFVRYEWSTGEVAASAGFTTGDIGNVSENSLYGTLNWATHF